MSVPSFETIKTDLKHDGVLLLTFSRPGGNAMSPQLFKDWHSALKFAESSKEVKVVVQTGAGKFYSSGKDLMPTMHKAFEKEMNDEMDVLEALINTFINFSKPLIAAINGPAIGLAVTSLAHFDFVYAAGPKTPFTTPFMNWGFCAEGCSSYLFPRLLGKHLANDLLIAGKTLSAERLAECNFLEIVSADDFLTTVLKKAGEIAKYDASIVQATKKLLNKGQRDQLMAVNHDELSLLRELMMRPGSRKAIQDFIDKRAARSKQKSKI